MPLRLFIVRHGETQWSLSGQHTGHADIPLTAHGMIEARQLGRRIGEIHFSRVLSSPLMRAKQTFELAGLGNQATIEADLVEWDNGEYEGRTHHEIVAERPSWNLFRDGCPGGEMPNQVSERADRLIKSLREMNGNVAIFTHAQLGRVLAARWIGLSVEYAQHLLLNTASLSILCYQRDQPDQPAISLWNSSSLEIFDNVSNSSSAAQAQLDASTLKLRAIERWENEGGEVSISKSGVSPTKTDQAFTLKNVSRHEP